MKWGWGWGTKAEAGDQPANRQVKEGWGPACRPTGKGGLGTSLQTDRQASRGWPGGAWTVCVDMCCSACLCGVPVKPSRAVSILPAGTPSTAACVVPGCCVLESFIQSLKARKAPPCLPRRDPFNDGLVPLLRLLSTGLSILIALAATGVTLVGFGASCLTAFGTMFD